MQWIKFKGFLNLPTTSMPLISPFTNISSQWIVCLSAEWHWIICRCGCVYACVCVCLSMCECVMRMTGAFEGYQCLPMFGFGHVVDRVWLVRRSVGCVALHCCRSLFNLYLGCLFGQFCFLDIAGAMTTTTGAAAAASNGSQHAKLAKQTNKDTNPQTTALRYCPSNKLLEHESRQPNVQYYIQRIEATVRAKLKYSYKLHWIQLWCC